MREGADQLGDGVSDGGAGNDIVLGGGAADIVKGGHGDDILYGGDGGPPRVRRRQRSRGRQTVFEGNIARSLGCERVVIGDPSVNDPNFDGVFGTPHSGKSPGSDG